MIPAGIGVVLCLAIRNFLRNNYSQDPKYVKLRQEQARAMAEESSQLPSAKEVVRKVFKPTQAELMEYREESAKRKASNEMTALAFAFGIIIFVLLMGVLFAH
jgi:hypothetical protein